MTQMPPVRHAQAGDVRLAYRAWLPATAQPTATAPPVVLLHALGEQSAHWSAVASALADFWPVYAPDLRGHGASDWPGRYTIDAIAADVAGLFDALGLRSAILVGHSMGGAAAYQFAARHPDRVRRLVLEDPAPPWPLPPRTPTRPAGPLDFDWDVTALGAELRDPPPSWRDALGMITAPTLIIAGGPDSHIDQRRLAEMAALIPRCQLTTIPAGHLVHAARPAEFTAAVARFGRADPQLRASIPEGRLLPRRPGRRDDETTNRSGRSRGQAAMPSQESYSSALKRVIEEVVAPGAGEVDVTGGFPRKQIQALAESGLLALTVPAEFGGAGGGPREAASVVRELGAVCGSTAMVVTMHYAATAAFAAAGLKDPLADIGARRHLSTLAFSESGSRSHFWAPLGTATPADPAPGGDIRLDASKSWVTSAGQADSYVWSSRPLAASAGPMTLWLVPDGVAGLAVSGAFDGLGLRGNASAPMSAVDVRVPREAMIGGDGAGLDLAMAAVLPVFLICSASMSAGQLRRLAEETAAHLQRTRLEHLGQSLAQQIQPRAQLARLRIEADRTWALVQQAVDAIEQGRPDAQLLVLEVKAAAGEAAADAADLALRACGGAAFRKQSPVERLFRDSRAARVMAPTTDALHDFIGRALCGLPLLGDVA